MKKRGQAAMEFLMTYGWAILAAVVVIGVLAYFGVFSPGKYLPQSCVTTAPFGCEEYSISEANGVSLVLRNGAGESLNVSSVAVEGCTTYTTETVISDSGTGLIITPCTAVERDKFKGDITITYRKVGGQIDQTSSGSITGTVVA